MPFGWEYVIVMQIKKAFGRWEVWGAFVENRDSFSGLSGRSAKETGT